MVLDKINQNWENLWRHVMDIQFQTILNCTCLDKYFSESFETLKVETTRHYAKDLRKKLVVIAMMSVTGPFNRYHEMKHNWAITHQNHLEFWNQKAKQGFSQQSKTFGPWANMFSPRPLIVKSLKEAWDWQSLINKQNFAIANYTSSWTFNVQSFTWFWQVFTEL